MNNIFAIGDIHGCFKSFSKLIDNLELKIGDKVILLGDLIDRGKDTRSCLDFVRNMKDYVELYCIRGNHEQLMIDAASGSPYTNSRWLKAGGNRVMDNFPQMNVKDIIEEYDDYFGTLIPYYATENYILTHGGLDFELDNPLEDTETMMWIRAKHCESQKIGGRGLVVGHSPVGIKKAKESAKNNLVTIDTGCVYHGWQEGMGYLTAFELNSQSIISVKNCDDN